MSEEPESKSPSSPPASPTDPQSQTQPATVNSLAGKRVVICEDEGILQVQLKRILTHAGLIVVAIAGDGQAGVEAVLRERPDLVLMDIKMPVMDGLEAARHIIAVYKACIVMLTAYATEEYRQEAAELGTCGYILKPITAQTLMPQLQQAFARFTDAKDGDQG
ncbi:MAG TPA: response regulator [Chthonomonadaceae bacterium]|nr:response regulator [Chthonomonadaceae bacterium]